MHQIGAARQRCYHSLISHLLPHCCSSSELAHELGNLLLILRCFRQLGQQRRQRQLVLRHSSILFLRRKRRIRISRIIATVLTSSRVNTSSQLLHRQILLLRRRQLVELTFLPRLPDIELAFLLIQLLPLDVVHRPVKRLLCFLRGRQFTKLLLTPSLLTLLGCRQFIELPFLKGLTHTKLADSLLLSSRLQRQLFTLHPQVRLIPNTLPVAGRRRLPSSKPLRPQPLLPVECLNSLPLIRSELASQLGLRRSKRTLQDALACLPSLTCYTFARYQRTIQSTLAALPSLTRHPFTRYQRTIQLRLTRVERLNRHTLRRGKRATQHSLSGLPTPLVDVLLTRPSL